MNRIPMLMPLSCSFSVMLSGAYAMNIAQCRLQSVWGKSVALASLDSTRLLSHGCILGKIISRNLTFEAESPTAPQVCAEPKLAV